MLLRKSSCLLPGVSLAAMATLLAAVPQVARATAFQGTPTVAFGQATIDTTVPGVDTITVAGTSPVTTINWAPSDTAINSQPITFLPTGQTGNFVVGSSLGGPYTVLNRILPTDPTRTVQLDGLINSTSDLRVWFYSPGGLLIGSSARFNVGGLVLTTADPVTDPNGNFLPNAPDRFSVASPAGSTSAIVIQPGAQLAVPYSGRSNYVVAVAPRIDQGGTISVTGNTALVAAESATFAVDGAGLFNITVDSGTTVSGNTFVHSGSTGGPDSGGATGASHRVYMVAVPKNNAVFMAIQSGGSIGFDVADAANLVGNTIVLSAGHNIADAAAVTGSPIVASPAGNGLADISVGHGNFTSNTYISATGNANISDGNGNIAPDITFASGLTVDARDASIFASLGTIKVAGNLRVSADATPAAPAGMALVGTAGSGTAVQVDGGISVSASIVDGTLPYGKAGSARVESLGGAITAVNFINVTAESFGQSAVPSLQTITTTGGVARVSAAGGGLIDVTNGSIAVSTNARSLNSPGTAQAGAHNFATDAHGGITQVVATGAGSIVRATSGIDASANAFGGTDLQTGNGGLAVGGSTIILADQGGLVTVTGIGDGLRAVALANGGSNAPSVLSPVTTTGDGIGGIAEVIAQDATIDVVDTTGITVLADGQGGFAFAPGNGGTGKGGIATAQTRGANAQILSDSSGNLLNGSENDSIAVHAVGIGGYVGANANANGASASAGSGYGGTATLSTTGPNQVISSRGGYDVTVLAWGETGSGGYGGSIARGGLAQVSANGGSIDIQRVNLSASAGGYGGYTRGASAYGGKVDVSASNGGVMSAQQSVSLFATASADINAVGGEIGVTSTSAVMQLTIDPQLGNMQVNASSSGGYLGQPAQSTPGSVRMASVAGGRLEIGSQTASANTVKVSNSIGIAGNSQVEIAADQDVIVSGTVGGNGADAYLRLRADLIGSGTGTVTLSGQPLGLTGAGTKIDIYYNPATFGTPTDYSSGVFNTAWTGYQLVNTYAKLQSVGNFLAQNFALSRNIDASPSIGTSFTPIGNITTPFTGNFDGLGFAISDLAISAPPANDVGLFGSVSAPNASVEIRNLGLINANIVGVSNVGGLIGNIPTCVSCFGVTIAESFVTGRIQGAGQVGGLIGAINQPTIVFRSHSDTDITLNGVSLAKAGGLVGYANGAIIRQSFANGSILSNSQYDAVGGLVGWLETGSSIADAYASGSLTVGAGSTNIGGLVGYNDGRIDRAYAVNSLTVGTGSSSVGGLVGLNASDNAFITESYASGQISAAGSSAVGGYIGTDNGGIGSSYWDSFSTGQSQGAGTGQGLGLSAVTSDPAQAAAVDYALNLSSYGNFSSNWTTVSGLTRPMGLWEMPYRVPFLGPAAVYSAHAVQLLSNNPGALYQLGHDIDMAGTSSGGDVWGQAGFVPIGVNRNNITAFTGGLFGNGRVLSNLTSLQPGYNTSGLFAVLDGFVDAVGLVNVAIQAPGNLNGPNGASGAGALAGINNGEITRSFATGLVGTSNGQSVTGGLVGQNNGQIINSYSSASVAPTSGGSALGGLVGQNTGTISYSYANGVLLPGGPSTVALGGLVGLNQASGVVDHSYWDAQRSTQSRGCGGVDCLGATGLNTAQTLLASSFAGWSIDSVGGQPNIWRIYDGDTTPLLKPFLRAVTVVPVGLTQQYNATVITPTLEYRWGNNGRIYGAPVFSGLGRNVGSYSVQYTKGLYSDQLGYDLITSPISAAVAITPAPLTLSAVTDNRRYNATTSSSGQVLFSGLQGQDSITGLTQSFDSANAGARTLIVNSGFTINDGNGGNNYVTGLNTQSGTINTATLTITYTANAASRLYGGTNPALTGSAVPTGLFGSDTLSGVTSGTASFTTLATSTSHVGSYLITGSGLAGNSTNYNFSFVQAAGNASALTINPAALTVTADAQSRAFGAANPPLTFVAQGLVNQDTLTGALATNANTTSPAGSYAITQGSLAASTDYLLSYVGNNLVVAAGTQGALTGTETATNMASQAANPSQSEQEDRQAAEDAVQHAATPKVLIATVVDADGVTQPVPVDEPVTSNGNVGQ